MIKKLLLILITGIFFSCICDSFTTVNIFDEPKINFQLDTLKEKISEPNANFEIYYGIQVLNSGYDIYVPPSNRKGYRYGPSILYYEDGSIDVWFSSPGNNSTEWDYIRYRHFDGENWEEEEVVLKPTKKSLDHYSVCDPGVIYFDGYYYLGYTSTIYESGTGNQIFVARSKKPNGPFEKWDGEGWSNQNPEPIIAYEGDSNYFGASCISFVIVEDKLYCYYGYNEENHSYIKLSIASLCENWPSTLVEQGPTSIFDGYGDTFDVIYVEELKQYFALSIAKVFSIDSYVCVFVSDDGIHFKESKKVSDYIYSYSLCLGISKRDNGHVSVQDNLFIGYAYCQDEMIWGKWACRFQPIQIVPLLKIEFAG